MTGCGCLYQCNKLFAFDVQDDCSWPFVSCDFITSGRSGGGEYGVKSKASKSPFSCLQNNHNASINKHWLKFPGQEY